MTLSYENDSYQGECEGPDGHGIFRPYGKGIYTFNNANLKGTDTGIFEGFTTMTWGHRDAETAEGVKYVGKIKNGKKHGWGKETMTSSFESTKEWNDCVGFPALCGPQERAGDFREGHWKEDVFMEGTMQGYVGSSIVGNMRNFHLWYGPAHVYDGKLHGPAHVIAQCSNCVDCGTEGWFQDGELRDGGQEGSQGGDIAARRRDSKKILCERDYF